MANVEKLSVALTRDMAAMVRQAVDSGDYASSSEVIRDALRAWKDKRALRPHDAQALRIDINRGLADIAAGRVSELDAERIVAEGKRLSRERARSA